MNVVVAVAVLAGTSIVARPAEAGCARYMIANVDTCANPPCPVVICRLIGEGGGYCMYTC
ncbi:MAG: hypothetical protein KJ062_03450 [Thermoanaerobaculia bacterium]|nr:hypothetical protein [Thermoanaerobaculia bacterium]